MTNIYIYVQPLWKVKGFFKRTSWKVSDVHIVRKTWVLSSFSVSFSVSVSADVVQFCPNKKVRQVSFAINLSIRNSIIGVAADVEEVLTADMQHWRDALRISFKRTVGSKYLLNKKYLPLLVLSTDRLKTLGWILSSTSTVQSRIWMSLLLLLSLAVRLWFLLPAQNQDLWPRKRRRKRNSTGTHTHINLVPFVLETTSWPDPHARKFFNYLLRDADNRPIAVRDTWSTIQSVLRSAISKQQLTEAVT